MINIFINVDAIDGCALHRLILPYSQVYKDNKEEFNVTWGFSKSGLTIKEKLEELKGMDIFLYHRMLEDGVLDAIRKEYPNMKIVLDIDDYWRLNDMHQAYWMYKQFNFVDKIVYHIKNSDYVTTTTEVLAKKIRELNKHVIVFPNALNKEGQFKPAPIESKKLRFGLIGGASHEKDIELLEGVTKQLPPDVLEKVQIVLCGFDKGVYVNNDGSSNLQTVPWETNIWTKVEEMLTDKYRLVSAGHKDFLRQFQYKVDYQTEELYRRVWARDIKSYATLYNEIDVLLVPLVGNDFTACKSELKLIEASVMGKPVIASDVIPYSTTGVNAIVKGGDINPEGNCILVNNNKGSRGWVKAITKLVRDEHLRNMIKENIEKLTESGKYCLTDVAKERAKFLKGIV